MDTKPVPATPKNPARRIIPPRPVQAAIVIGSFVAVLYLIELINLAVLHGSLDSDGVVPRSVSGLDGVIWGPLLHASWAHLISNTVPLLVFGFLAMAGGLGQWIAVTVCVWLISGLGVWLTGPSHISTIGASGIAFGWLAFLLVRGLFNRSLAQLAIAFVLLAYWGSVLWGLLPGRPDISWQAHVFGALGGILAAWLAAKATRASRRAATPPTIPPTAPPTIPPVPGSPGNLGL